MVEQVQNLLKADRIKLAPFNSSVMRMFMRFPPVGLSDIKEGWNRFFAEGAPEYRAPTLVPIAIAREALLAISSMTQQDNAVNKGSILWT